MLGQQRLISASNPPHRCLYGTRPTTTNSRPDRFVCHFFPILMETNRIFFVCHVVQSVVVQVSGVWGLGSQGEQDPYTLESSRLASMCFCKPALQCSLVLPLPVSERPVAPRRAWWSTSLGPSPGRCTRPSTRCSSPWATTRGSTGLSTSHTPSFLLFLCFGGLSVVYH